MPARPARPRGRNRFSRPGHRRSGQRCRRGGVQHRHDRLPGDPYRSLLLPPDRDAYLPAHRQHRGEPGGRRVRPRACLRPGDPRSAHAGEQLAQRDRPVQLPAPAAGGGHRRDRYPQAHAHPARARRTERLPDGRPCRRGRGRGAGSCLSRPGRDGPGEGGELYAALPMGRDGVDPGQGLRQPGGGPPCGGLRLRHQAQHHAGSACCRRRPMRARC
jgi:hypothetical protein